MQERGINQGELARRVGSSEGNMSRLLRGERGFGLGLVLRICRALEVTPTRLLEENPPERFFDAQP